MFSEPKQEENEVVLKGGRRQQDEETPRTLDLGSAVNQQVCEVQGPLRPDR